MRITDRKIRPPSMGKPGKRLNAPSITFIQKNQLSIEASHILVTGMPRISTSSTMNASKKLTAGPAMAVKNSFHAVRGSAIKLAHPPRREIVMSRVL